jgi:hypothetical protein
MYADNALTLFNPTVHSYHLLLQFYCKDNFVILDPTRKKPKCVILVCALLGYYSASSCNFLPMFRDKIYVPSRPLNMGQVLVPKRAEEVILLAA